MQDIIQQASTAVKTVGKMNSKGAFSHGTTHAKKLQLTEHAATDKGAENTLVLPSKKGDATAANGDSDSSLTAMRETISIAIAAMHMLSCAMLGVLSLQEQEPEQVKSASPSTAVVASPTPPRSCAVCKKDESPSQSLHRCSKCKAVYYCCREHQLQHWPVHKSTCGREIPVVAADVASGRGSTATSVVADQLTADKPYTARDIVDPDVLLSNSQLQEYSAHINDETNSSVRKIAHLMLRNMEAVMSLALHVMHQYLHYKSIHATVLSTDTGLVTGTDLVSYSKRMTSRSASRSHFIELVKSYAVLAAYATECIANTALVLGYDHFSVMLMEVST